MTDYEKLQIAILALTICAGHGSPAAEDALARIKRPDIINPSTQK